MDFRQWFKLQLNQKAAQNWKSNSKRKYYL